MPVQRTFYAVSVEEALACARLELGEDALLLDARATIGTEKQLGEYRADFQAPDPEVEKPHHAGRGSGRSPLPEQPDAATEALKTELRRLSSLLSHVSAGLCGSGWSPEMAPTAAALTALDLPADLVAALLDRIERRLRLRNRLDPVQGGLLRQTLIAEAESRLAADPSLGRNGSARRMVALAGPSGSGKTTTLVKLAAHAGLACGTPTLILSTDTYRIAATEQLRTYAAILGLPFAVADSAASLARCLNEHRQKELILIDTPGFGPREQDLALDWASRIGAHPDIEVQLVLAATTRTQDAIEALQWWEPFAPSKLIFTRLDETERPGGCLAAAMLSGKPVSYLCAGQQIPEDLEPATMAGLIRLLAGTPTAAGAAA